jgi:hypothetical protein
MSDSAEHSIGIYLKIWLLLFVLSSFSYMVDWYQLQGYLRWFPGSDLRSSGYSSHPRWRFLFS